VLGSIEGSVPGADPHDAVALRCMDDRVSIATPTGGGRGRDGHVAEVLIEEEAGPELAEIVLIVRSVDSWQGEPDRRIAPSSEVGRVMQNLLGGLRQAVEGHR